MDLNLVVLCGRLAAPPELRTFDGPEPHVRLLLAIRTEAPKRRLDLIPVVTGKSPGELADFPVGERVWVAGMLQRRIRNETDSANRASEVEVVAYEISRHRKGTRTASGHEEDLRPGS